MTAKKLWDKLGKSAIGRWLFARIICFKAPYFASISPGITELTANKCVGFFHQKRKVQNHIGTVNAIALCNLAELCAGLMVDVSLPQDMRWIPQGMTVKYLKKAKGKMTATAEPAAAFYSSQEAYSAIAKVAIHDDDNAQVFTADITMWISPRK